MKKNIILILFLTLLSSSLVASQFLVGMNGGSLSFDEGFDSAQEYGVHAVFASRSGMAIDGSLSYFEVDNEAGDASLSAMPVLAGVTYIIGKGSILPYIGAMGGLSLLGGDYDGTAITYGAKAGLSFNVDRDFRLFLEARKLFIEEESSTLEPLTVSLGCSVIFGKTPGKRPVPFINRRRPGNPRYEAAKQRRLPKRPPIRRRR